MTDFQALVAAIRANPNDDLPRLVAADWLDENDQPERAEFVRLCVRLANTPGYDPDPCKVCGATPDRYGEVRHGRGCYTQSEDGGGSSYADRSPEWVALRDRAKAMCAANAGRWFGDGWEWYRHALTGELLVAHPDGTRLRLDRGFVRGVDGPLAALMGRLPALVRAEPVRRVVPSDVEPYPAERDEGITGYRRTLPDLAAAWGWVCSEPHPSDPDGFRHPWVPERLFRRLSGGVLREGSRNVLSSRFYMTAGDAVAAMSDALLTWAGERTTAGVGA